MTEEVKNPQKDMEKFLAYPNFKEVYDESLERDTQYERRVKIFAHVILIIGIIYAAYSLYELHEWYNYYESFVAPTVDYYSQSSGLSSVEIGAARGASIGGQIGKIVENLILYVVIWIALTLSANASIRSKENEARIKNMLGAE